MRSRLLKEWLSPVAIATYLGTGGTLVAFLEKQTLLAVVFLSVLVVLLFLSNLHIYRRYSYFKRCTQIDSDLHRLTHRTRDHVVELRMISNVYEAEEKSAAAVKGVLTTASTIFTTIVGETCMASLMLERNGTLRTVQYCHQVEPERENKPSRALAAGEGIAGEAFAVGDVVVWGDGDPSFKGIRDDHANFYRSGMCTPFKLGLRYAGLLNIDSKKVGAFQKETHKQIAATIADQIGVIMECLSLWRDQNGR